MEYIISLGIDPTESDLNNFNILKNLLTYRRVK